MSYCLFIYSSTRWVRRHVGSLPAGNRVIPTTHHVEVSTRRHGHVSNPRRVEFPTRPRAVSIAQRNLSPVLHAGREPRPVLRRGRPPARLREGRGVKHRCPAGRVTARQIEVNACSGPTRLRAMSARLSRGSGASVASPRMRRTSSSIEPSPEGSEWSRPYTQPVENGLPGLPGVQTAGEVVVALGGGEAGMAEDLRRDPHLRWILDRQRGGGGVTEQ